MTGSFHQLVPIVNSKDAIGRMALSLHRTAKGSGLRSLIFTERQQEWMGPLRRGALMPSPPKQKADWLVYHHSTGTPVAEQFLRWPAQKKVLIYHNITPPELLEQPDDKKNAEYGLKQLDELLKVTDRSIGLSRFTCQTLKERNAPDVVQIPFVSDRLPNPPGSVDDNQILVVGRIVPHKGVLEAIEAFQSIRREFPKLHMKILGNLNADRHYAGKVLAKADWDPRIEVLGRVSNRKLDRLYRKSGILLSLSKHEGFCVPIMESLCCKTIVIASPAGAIPETLGDGGILLKSGTPQEAANALRQVLAEEAYREKMLQRAAKRAADFRQGISLEAILPKSS